MEHQVQRIMFVLMFAVIGNAYESVLSRQYVIFPGSSGNLRLGLVERIQIGGKIGFPSERWEIQPVVLTNCKNLRFTRDTTAKIDNALVPVKPVSCDFTVQKHGFSSNPEFGFVQLQTLNGTVKGQSGSVNFQFFRLAWRAHIDDRSNMSNVAGEFERELYFQ